MFKRILVPLDGSELATRALPPALTLARQTQAEVFLLQVPVIVPVVTSPMAEITMPYPIETWNRSERIARNYLTNLQRSLKDSGVPIRCWVRHGAVAETIIQAASEEKVDLIVMSSHGYSGLTRWLLGSVAERVLSGAPCPVVVVRSSEPLRRMLVPLDGSPLSEQALEPALDLAAGLGLPVVLFRAVPVLPADEVERLETAERGFGYRLQDGLRFEAETYLNSLAAQHSDRQMEITTAVGFEPAADSILSYAAADQADLIAMATHGHRGVQRWMYGSVTEKVLRGGSHSMLVVRSTAEAPAMATVEVAGQAVQSGDGRLAALM